MQQLIFFLSDNESLAHYSNCKFVSFSDVKRRLFLKAREQNRSMPDSYFLLAQEETFRNVASISGIMTRGLRELADGYLEFSEQRVYVKSNRQTDWQELITYIPPLFLQCVFLQDKVSVDRSEASSVVTLVKRILLPNTRYTAIPSARIPQLDYYLQQQQGLHDLHMHLNGALETDQVWQDYLFSPNKIYKDLMSAFADTKVKEQLEQESHLLDPDSFISLLRTAQRLRNYFFDFLFPNVPKLTEDDVFRNRHVLLYQMVHKHADYPGGYKHPFSVLLGGDGNASLMTLEALMYILLLKELEKVENETLAGLFHFYLLILGLTNRLLVQQTHQNGFDQFQKHTLNGLREHSERTYRRRYYQMHGNDLRHLSFLEGRFSPKKTEADLIAFIDSIWQGWEFMCKKIVVGKEEGEANANSVPKLRLIAHFIKRRDKKPNDFVRHKELRYDLWQRGKVLGLLLSKHARYRERVTAVDAAANEFDAAPEVFAPVFRLMRRFGVMHFTYHAGEDFYHIPGGLRAIYEAIVFCDLRNGDRIGHATAAGLSVVQWKQVVGDKIVIRQGEYLDDLIFTYHLIIVSKIESLHSVIPFIVNKIQDLSFDIYGDYYPVSVLENAWLMRQCCPIHTLELERENAELKNVFNDEEWRFPVTSKFVEKRKDIAKNKAWDLYRRYHDANYRKDYDKTIEVNPFEMLNSEQITRLQLALLHEMNQREIVIETLPTSNVRIGFHRSFRSYHLYNWVKWREEGASIPPIVVGSDDTGIFATNIYNEYANIYSTLLKHNQMPHDKVMAVIKKLDEDSRTYRFE
ncbi:hypothetical protein ACTJJB_08545 [Chitinophaga sp. 22536]|uniref:hypothetical protein n=1 Tax=unclassified Chitinophaga TaxID=2619133 RepID=UPI003F87CAFD